MSSEKKKKPTFEEYVLANKKPTFEEYVLTHKEPEEESSLEFFKGSKSFEDGFDYNWMNGGIIEFGEDVLDTVLGTGADLLLDVGKGALTTVEGLGDFGAYGVAWVHDVLGADDGAEALRDFAKMNSTEDLFAPLEEEVEPYSVLGNTLDSTSQGLGQLMLLKGFGKTLGAVGASEATTSNAILGGLGVSSVGMGTSEAYQHAESSGKEITDEEALIYGLGKGAIDTITESIFGGIGKSVNALGFSRGLSSLDDVFAKKLSSSIANQTMKNFVEFGVKSSAEGLEEVMAAHSTAVLQKLTIMSDKELETLVSDQNALEQFVSATLSTAMMQSGYIPKTNQNGTLRESNAQGRDYITGLNQNEQTVLEKVYEDTVNKRTEAGEKLTRREERRIYEEITEALERGELDTDAIGRIFAEETYNRYMESAKQEEEQLKEPQKKLNELNEQLESLEGQIEENSDGDSFTEFKNNKIKNQIEETKKLIEETESQIKDIKSNSGRFELQEQMDAESFAVVKDSKLAQSYAEKGNRRKKIEVNLDSYTDENAKQSAKNFMEFGANNTKASHDFLELITKVAKDRGRIFKFMTTKQLKESIKNGNPYGISEDAKRVEAFVSKNEIIINMDANKAFSSLVGHEITHTLEGDKVSYGKFQDALFELAKARGEYDSRWKSIQRRYPTEKGYTKEKQLQELTADLVGDYIFGDSNYVQNLATENPNVFKRIYNEIKYLWKLASAGSKEKRQLEKAKRKFELAWREAGKSKGGDTRLSVAEDDYQRALENDDTETMQRLVEDAAKENGYELHGYHGTHKGGFTEFNAKYSEDGASIFIAKNKETAQTYTRDYSGEDIDLNSNKEQDGVYHVAVKMQNPYIVDAKGKNWNQLTNEDIESRFKIQVKAVKEGIGYKYVLDVVEEKVTDQGRFYKAVSEKHLIKNQEFDSITEVRDALPNNMARSLKRSIAWDLMKKDSNAFETMNATHKDTYNLMSDWIDINKNGERVGLHTTNAWAEYAKENGHDGVIIKDVYDIGKQSRNAELERGDIYIAFDGEQIKSLNPVTYDNDGNAIPLSERFNSEKKDIRYSISDSEGTNIDNRIMRLEEEQTRLTERISELESNEEFQEAKRMLNFAETFIEKVEARKALKVVKEKIGYSDIVEERAGIERELVELRKQKKKQKEPFKVRELSESDYTNLKKHFGTTTKFNLAGYMLKDGTMLDFSGKHWGDTYSDMRTVDHRDVMEAFNDTSNSGTEEMINMISNGNIRLMNETGGINLSKMPTASQREVLERYIRTHRGEVIVDIDAHGGDTVKSFTYDKGTSAEEIFRDIENYFKGGKQSDLMRFHTGYSDVRYSVSEETDRDYLEAVNRGDTETARRMVDEIANATMQKSKLRTEDGRLRKVYHGTNTGDFNVFNTDYIGMSSGDDGFFGKGFYFAYSKGEAGYYGASRIISAYLDLQKPFNFEKEFAMYKGKKGSSGYAPDAVRMMNFADKFPEIAKDITIDVVEKGNTEYKSISLAEFSEAFKNVIENQRFDYQEMKNEWGEKETLVTSDRKVVEYEYDGKKRSYTDYGFQRRFYGVPYEYDVAYEYLATSVYDHIDMYSFTRLILDNNDAFTEELKARGYDGTIQSEHGDEAVAFYPQQIKSSEAITYDDKGNVIPLSKRFDASDSDIRYRLADDSEYTSKAYGRQVFGEDLRVAPVQESNPQNSLGGEYSPKGNYNVYGSDIGIAPVAEDIAPTTENIVQDNIAPMEVTEETAETPEDIAPTSETEQTGTSESESQQVTTRAGLHGNIVNNIKEEFKAKGFDFDNVLKEAKNLSTFATVDNTPQRVIEKSLGYKAGQILNDLTVNKVAQNESEGIKWLNSFTDRKNGLLAQISKQYKIKPGSKESAAAQMYAEGFYVNDKNEIIKYGDEELAKDFPYRNIQNNIKGLANDPRIRQIYDETLDMINESRARNLYPEIPRLDNYFLHFRAMDDTFSKLGLPFNPNDIRAKDLPTDLNGVTADLKPGQPYFASAMHRTGKRTSFDLLGGLERYLTSAKNQIYHIDDIQTLRALRNYVADTYGQANGLEDLDSLSEEEAQNRIEQVYNSHLSTFAKFLNEEANVLAGKTALIDRGLEGIIGRRGISFLNTVNGQVGSNMVGFNVSSSLTNFLAVTQALAKTNKADFLKAFAQTTSNKIGTVFGKNDGFAETSPVMIRRKGSDRFHRTPFQKIGDAGYVLMSAVDNISTELIARTKYNELTRKGMDSQKAHFETDKWVSRLMGDRSLGQMPQLYNSKMLGLITKFQLEVRNQLDSQFYDTIQEAKVSNEHIQNGLAKNAKTAAKVTSTLVQLAIGQHLFGKAFESVAGYNPAFDIIEVLMKTFGFDDDEESEDTALDNIEQGFLALLEDLPYAGTLTGGRIPISSALPIEELVKGVDEYGNEKSRLETLKEIAPYYLLPTGYGQIKKSYQGWSMFSDDHPISGSYTDSGNLRFPVEDTIPNRIKSGLFGQWASPNARQYFDEGRSPLKEKQLEEFMEVDLPIQDYWEYRDGLKGLDTLAEKGDYINSLDFPIDKKNILINNIADREVPIDLSGYTDEFDSFEEFDFAMRYPEKYKVLQEQGVSVQDYNENKKETAFIYTDDYSWAADYPEKYAISKAIADDVTEYKQYASALNEIQGDKDSNGKTISGSKKKKQKAYIFSLDLDYGQQAILYRSMFDSNADKNEYNYDIVEYLNGRDDISYKEMKEILEALDMTVNSDGTVTW